MLWPEYVVAFLKFIGYLIYLYNQIAYCLFVIKLYY